MVTVASPGVYAGKPRPAVVVQADRWLQAHPSVTLCPLTSTLRQAPLVRIAVEPSRRNGLRKPSQLMVDNHLRMATAPQAAPLSCEGLLPAGASKTASDDAYTDSSLGRSHAHHRDARR